MITLPEGLDHVRTTRVFDRDTVPAGLLTTHRIASGVWGRLVIHRGSVTLRFEDEPVEAHVVGAGEHLVIPPDRPHHVEFGPGDGAFSIEFHRTDEAN